MIRVFRLICFIHILIFSFGCATPMYHMERGKLVPTKTVSKEDLGCGKILDDKVEVAQEYIDYINRQLPDEYFDKNAPCPDTKSLKPHVEVTALDVKAGASVPPLIFTAISPQGQQAIIEHLNIRSKDIDNDAKVLGKLFKTLRTEKAEGDPYRPFDPLQQIRLVVSASLNSSNPADRLEKVYAFLFVPEDALIVDAERLETEKPQINFGTQTTEAGIAANLGASNPVGVGTASISPSYKQKLEREISKEFARRNIGINHRLNTLFISQDGQQGIDLSGNVLTTITLQLNIKAMHVTFFSLKEGEKKFRDFSQRFLDREEYPLLNNGDVHGVVFWVVQVRHVVSGGATILEDDDIVVPQVFSGWYKVTLWENPEVFYFLTLQYKSLRDDKNKRAVLVYEGFNKKPRLVAFRDRSVALTFKEELLKKYEGQKKVLEKSHKATPLTLTNDLKVGFTVDASGDIKKDVVNIIWKVKDDKGEPVDVDLNNLMLSMTEPSFFPLEEYVRDFGFGAEIENKGIRIKNKDIIERIVRRGTFLNNSIP